MKYAIGLDIGGTKIAAGLVNEKGELGQKEIVKSKAMDKESMYTQVVTCINQLLNQTSIPVGEIYGVGAGIPGKVDRENGVAIFQNNLPWANFPFAKRLKDSLGIDRIVIDNDVHMAAFAEWKRAGLQKNELFVYMTISTGISCSIIQGGEFIRGNGFAGELGLIPVFTPNIEKQMERLEIAASGLALEKRAKKLFSNEAITTSDLFVAFNRGDPDAIQLIDNMAGALAQGVYMINSLLDPQQIVFGGSVSTNNPFLLEIVKEKLYPYMIDEQRHILGEMHVSRDNDQGLIGAGLSVLNS
ncbi:ROK family protein [Aquibacillus saliphilus]|uniref:ROK family protein n=1 Tax=Aquibacillus saliphilus TaxID=1909422 RepID=UPI001CEFBE4A|nr:ROK family protein [Aquibacillus saliphilus]